MKGIIEVARLIRACHKIEGRVKLQKMVHILQEAGYSFDEEFGYLHHGPYSSDLKREIDQLVDWKLVTEEEVPVINYMRYTYSTSDMLPNVLREINADDEPGWKGLACDLNKKPSEELEAISTIMFLRRRGFSGPNLRNRFFEIKPHLESRFDVCLRQAEKIQQLGSRPDKSVGQD